MNTEFDSVYADLCERYVVVSPFDKVTARAAAKILVADDQKPSELATAEALLSRLVRPQVQAPPPQPLEVRFVSPEPTQQEFLRERAENELAAAKRRILDLEKALAAFERGAAIGEAPRGVVQDKPDFAALARLNSGGGLPPTVRTGPEYRTSDTERK
jgi:hypothetical protein